jgi:hypothetical protein
VRPGTEEGTRKNQGENKIVLDIHLAQISNEGRRGNVPPVSAQVACQGA